MTKGILLDFQEAKESLLTKRTAGPDPAANESLNDAIEAFAFSKLSKRNRIALVLAGIFGGEAENQLDNADQISYYMQADFTIPYKVPKIGADLTLQEVLS